MTTRDRVRAMASPTPARVATSVTFGDLLEASRDRADNATRPSRDAALAYYRVVNGTNAREAGAVRRATWTTRDLRDLEETAAGRRTTR